MKCVCVFAASSDTAQHLYGQEAQTLGRIMAAQNLELVYGAGKVGLMGTVARAIHEGGGHVTGVIPDRLNIPALTYLKCDNLIVTGSMAERKAIMTERSDGFVILPGGFGTLEELFEVLVLKQLGYHNKPIVFLNTRGAYDGLMAFFADMVDTGLVKEDQCNLFSVATSPEAAIGALLEYEATTVEDKWT